ncbi:hypothetical protein [Mucilaginibacter endophyticus]|uniref:hypothetical protein n=1 Tax=Mucilaginibacter endophyticus TaxID=2675003 RepID=UPI000E0D64C4|nr:hypothetical protein [Mucilaginibacter endophyticus]
MIKTESQQQNKNNKRTIWLITGISIILIIVSVFFVNKRFLTLCYLNFKNNHFKINDKLYAQDRLLDSSSLITLYRKVKPINGNSNGRPSMASSGWVISADSLRKYKTACIGVYTGYEIQSMENRNNKYFPMIFFSITTNKKALIKQDFDSNPPVGYEFEDGPLYVWAIEITDKESHILKK